MDADVQKADVHLPDPLANLIKLRELVFDRRIARGKILRVGGPALRIPVIRRDIADRGQLESADMGVLIYMAGIALVRDDVIQRYLTQSRTVFKAFPLDFGVAEKGLLGGFRNMKAAVQIASAVEFKFIEQDGMLGLKAGEAAAAAVVEIIVIVRQPGEFEVVLDHVVGQALRIGQAAALKRMPAVQHLPRPARGFLAILLA